MVFYEAAKLSLQVYKHATFNYPKTHTQVLIEQKNHILYIAYRGTDHLKDWMLNLLIEWESICPYANIDPKIKVHRGFLNGYVDSREDVLARITESDALMFVFTGHSLGAAEAVLAAVDAQFNLGIEPRVITFGAPAVGNSYFRDAYNERVPHTVRITNKWDPIPFLPFSFLDYQQVGTQERVPKFVFPYPHDMEKYYEGIMKNNWQLERSYPAMMHSASY